jgi:hypothetical protein
MKKLVIFMAILPILRRNFVVNGHLVHFVVILVYFSRLGILYQEKSGNRASMPL